MTTMRTCVFLLRKLQSPRAGWIQASLAPYSSERNQNRQKIVPESFRKYHVSTLCPYLLNNHGFIFIFWDRHWSSYPMLMLMLIWEVQQRDIWCFETWALQNPTMVDPPDFQWQRDLQCSLIKRDPQFSHPFVIFSCAVKRTETFSLLARQSKKAGYNNEIARRQAATVALEGLREAEIGSQWPNTGAMLLQGRVIPASEGYKQSPGSHRV